MKIAANLPCLNRVFQEVLYCKSHHLTSLKGGLVIPGTLQRQAIAVHSREILNCFRNQSLPKRDRFLKTHLPRMPSSAFTSCPSAASIFLSSEVTMIHGKGLSSCVLPLHFFPTKLEEHTTACSLSRKAGRLRFMKINAKRQTRSYLCYGGK